MGGRAFPGVLDLVSPARQAEAALVQIAGAASGMGGLEGLAERRRWKAAIAGRGRVGTPRDARLAPAQVRPIGARGADRTADEHRGGPRSRAAASEHRRPEAPPVARRGYPDEPLRTGERRRWPAPDRRAPTAPAPGSPFPRRPMPPAENAR